MNKHKIKRDQFLHSQVRCCVNNLLAAMLGMTLLSIAPVYAAEPQVGMQNILLAAVTPKKAVRPVPSSTEIVPSVELSLGQSHLVRLPAGVNLQRVKVDDEKVVQVDVTSPREVVLHAKSIGSTMVIILDKSGQSAVMDVRVVAVTTAMDAASLHAKLQQIMPSEKGIKVSTAADSLVLSGTVADAVKVDQAMALAEAYGGKDKDKKVINMLRVAAPQQVMLEVKMAEVSKNLLDKLGASFGASRSNGGVAYAIASGFLSLTGADPLSPGGLLTITHGNKEIKIDAENKEGVVKILAEPNIIAISGQEGSFLAGGKIFIPVPQNNAVGGASIITLEERDFGVGLRFTPTVLEEGLINLRVAPEVSELTQGGTTVGGSVFPSFTVRRVSTTVQLRDGQSFAIAGLIKNNITESIRRFPILGDIPILGALFRSSSFQEDKTELLFVITPRLVKPLPPNFALPTDSFNPPSKTEFFLNGQLEGKPADSKTTDPADSAPVPQPNTEVPEPNSAKEGGTKDGGAQDGFEMK
ncbi:MAG: type II and III secretion system protein family protein [Methylotenera sp.]|jgi:pilus assembly protein CpaC|uniref:type II and III secretion system protein family protein n=1 Tax=Methylotenera sp. TaxID=2051956 RepID=UPI002719EF46|nr:type II and III secretion system protein family protein [Methylotenera sp.]MDO9151914.1 type II and III secretion system protein family protein [Methylotenera sp.]